VLTWKTEVAGTESDIEKKKKKNWPAKRSINQDETGDASGGGRPIQGVVGRAGS